MAFVNPFTIDGVVIPTPDEYKFGIEDMSSEATGRTLDATMHKDVVAVKDYYTLTWKNLSWANAARLLNAVDGKTEAVCSYADPRVPGRFLTGRFYIGKREGSALNLNNPLSTWKDITLTYTRI